MAESGRTGGSGEVGELSCAGNRPPTEVRVRVERSDGAAGCDLLAAFAREIGELYPGWHPGVGPSAEPEELVAPHGAFLVAYEGDRAVACGALKRLDAGAAEVKRLYVLPSARGAGVARRVLAELELTARRLGYGVVRLDTGDRQPGALALFRSAGYRDIGDYNGNPAARHWLEKRL